MRSAVRLGLVAAALAFILAAAPALAKPVAFASLDVTLLEEKGQTALMDAGMVPETVKLPAEVQLALPAGAEVQWVGELMSQDGTGDFEVPYKKTTAGGSDIYTLTLTKSRVGQVEALVPAVTAFDGTTYVTDFTWTPVADAPSARISVRIPGTARIAQVAQNETGKILPGDGTYSYFSKTVEGVKAGTPLSLQFSYTLAPASPAAGGSSGSNGIVIALLIALAIAVFALALVAIRRKAAARDGETGFVFDDPDDYAPADPEAGAPLAAEEPVDVSDLDADAPPAAPRSKTPLFILVGVVALAVIVGVVAGNRSTTAQNLGGAISRTYGTGEACTQASIAITPAEGVNLAEQGNTLLAALEQVPGIGNATILEDEGRIEIGYCDSTATEDDLRAVLASTGIVEVAAASQDASGTPSAEATEPLVAE